MLRSEGSIKSTVIYVTDQKSEEEKMPDIPGWKKTIKTIDLKTIPKPIKQLRDLFKTDWLCTDFLKAFVYGVFKLVCGHSIKMSVLTEYW